MFLLTHKRFEKCKFSMEMNSQTCKNKKLYQLEGLIDLIKILLNKRVWIRRYNDNNWFSPRIINGNFASPKFSQIRHLPNLVTNLSFSWFCIIFRRKKKKGGNGVHEEQITHVLPNPSLSPPRKNSYHHSLKPPVVLQSDPDALKQSTLFPLPPLPHIYILTSRKFLKPQVQQNQPSRTNNHLSQKHFPPQVNPLLLNL